MREENPRTPIEKKGSLIREAGVGYIYSRGPQFQAYHTRSTSSQPHLTEARLLKHIGYLKPSFAVLGQYFYKVRSTLITTFKCLTNFLLFRSVFEFIQNSVLILCPPQSAIVLNLLYLIIYCTKKGCQTLQAAPT